MDRVVHPGTPWSLLINCGQNRLLLRIYNNGGETNDLHRATGCMPPLMAYKCRSGASGAGQALRKVFVLLTLPLLGAPAGCGILSDNGPAGVDIVANRTELRKPSLWICSRDAGRHAHSRQDCRSSPNSPTVARRRKFVLASATSSA